MYQVIVEEIGGRELLWVNCRISALSAADYCLEARRETGANRISWQGNARQIRRLFQAERLPANLKGLKPFREYAVVFLKNERESLQEPA